MSTYQNMWDEINKLNKHETERWLYTIGAPNGRSIHFYRVVVLDVDLVEALKYYKTDLEQAEDKAKKLTLEMCETNWPDCVEGEYNPQCCRFPKSCSAPVSHRNYSEASDGR